jgi:hypothetical protein
LAQLCRQRGITQSKCTIGRYVNLNENHLKEAFSVATQLLHERGVEPSANVSY